MTNPFKTERCEFTNAWVVRRKDGAEMDNGKYLRVFGTREEARTYMRENA